MKKLMKTRNVLSMTALSAALSMALIGSPAVAGENDTYKSIHNGWLSEYQVKSSEVRVSSNSEFRAISAENNTFASVHDGWLSEYEDLDTAGMVAMFDVSQSAAYEGATRKDWLDTDGYRQ